LGETCDMMVVKSKELIMSLALAHQKRGHIQEYSTSTTVYNDNT